MCITHTNIVLIMNQLQNGLNHDPYHPVFPGLLPAWVNSIKEKGYGTAVWKSPKKGLGNKHLLISFAPHIVGGKVGWNVSVQTPSFCRGPAGLTKGQAHVPPPPPPVSLVSAVSCSVPQTSSFTLYVFTTMLQMCSEVCRASNVTGLQWETIAESK